MKSKNSQSRTDTSARLTFESVKAAIADQGELHRRPHPTKPGSYQGFLIYVPGRSRPVTYTRGVQRITSTDNFGLAEALRWAEKRRAADKKQQQQFSQRYRDDLALMARRLGKDLSLNMVREGDRIVSAEISSPLLVLSSPVLHTPETFKLHCQDASYGQQFYYFGIDSRWNLVDTVDTYATRAAR